jgi:hypothetical protein
VGIPRRYCSSSLASAISHGRRTDGPVAALEAAVRSLIKDSRLSGTRTPASSIQVSRPTGERRTPAPVSDGRVARGGDVRFGSLAAGRSAGLVPAQVAAQLGRLRSGKRHGPDVAHTRQLDPGAVCNSTWTVTSAASSVSSSCNSGGGGGTRRRNPEFAAVPPAAFQTSPSKHPVRRCGGDSPLSPRTVTRPRGPIRTLEGR